MQYNFSPIKPDPFHLKPVSYFGLLLHTIIYKFYICAFRDTIIVAVGNCSTSIFAGFVIYSYIGNLAHETNTGVGEVSRDGKTF